MTFFLFLLLVLTFNVIVKVEAQDDISCTDLVEMTLKNLTTVVERAMIVGEWENYGKEIVDDFFKRAITVLENIPGLTVPAYNLLRQEILQETESLYNSIRNLLSPFNDVYKLVMRQVEENFFLAPLVCFDQSED